MAVKDDVNRLLDVFGGADGGVEFCYLKFGLEGLEKKVESGTHDSESAAQLLQIVSRFRALVDVFTKR